MRRPCVVAPRPPRICTCRVCALLRCTAAAIGMAFRSARLEDKDNRTIACLLCEHTITAEVNLLPQNMWYMAHDYQNETRRAPPCWRNRCANPAAYHVG